MSILEKDRRFRTGWLLVIKLLFIILSVYEYIEKKRYVSALVAKKKKIRFRTGCNAFSTSLLK